MITKKISRRGRPRGFDVERAIATAMTLFHQRGYDSVGVAELSQAIGITAPSLYAAFGNKRGLFEQALQHYVQANSGWLSEALAGEDDLEIAIARLFECAANTYTAHANCLGCLVLNSTQNCNDTQARALTTGFRMATRQMIGDRITTGAPHLPSPNVEILSDYAMTILVGLSGSARDGMTANTLRATAAIAAAGFIQQLQKFRDEAKLPATPSTTPSVVPPTVPSAVPPIQSPESPHH